MPIAHNAGCLPSIADVFPYDDEFCNAAALALRQRTKGMLAFFESAIILDGINFETARNEDALYFAADVTPRVFQDDIATYGDATVIMIELDV